MHLYDLFDNTEGFCLFLCLFLAVIITMVIVVSFHLLLLVLLCVQTEISQHTNCI